MNGYPKRFVRRLRQISRSVRREEEEDREKPVATAVIPYICGVSEAVRRILKPLNIRTAFKPTLTLRKTLVRVKDRVQMNKKTAVIYKIPCGQCDRVYIGQTSRTLEQRIKEHKRALKNFDVDASGLAEHVLEENHSVDGSKVMVIEVQCKCLQR